MFTPRRHRDAMQAQKELIFGLNAEVDRQLTSTEATSAAISTRASILVAAAGLTSGVQLSTESALPALFTAMSALLGVALLVMRTASEVPISEAEARFWTDSPVVAIRNLMHWKLGVLRERERSLARRRRVLILGFGLLAASIATDLLSTIIQRLAGG